MQWAMQMLEFTEDEIQRYARHILLPEVGAEGQARLRASSVLIIGAGGLGSPVALYLAAAGVGRIGIVDDDHLELSNLQRQVLHTTDRVGMAKVESATHALRALNPGVEIVPIRGRIDAASAPSMIGAYDLVCDGSDNFSTRYVVADACVQAERTLVSASVLRFEGQLSTFHPHKGGPCYRCLYPAAPPDDMAPSCAQAGVFGAVTGVLGTLQATEALKELLGIGQSMAGRLLMWNALSAAFHTITLVPDPDCPVCHGRGARAA